MLGFLFPAAASAVDENGNYFVNDFESNIPEKSSDDEVAVVVEGQGEWLFLKAFVSTNSSYVRSGKQNLRLYKKRDLQTLFNDSLNQTLARTINTSVSTLIVLLCIFIFGGASIRSFSFAMILGVIFGTLSSIFIAAPTAYLTMGRKIQENEAEAEAK